jgi:hypothetical protein
MKSRRNKNINPPEPDHSSFFQKENSQENAPLGEKPFFNKRNAVVQRKSDDGESEPFTETLSESKTSSTSETGASLSTSEGVSTTTQSQTDQGGKFIVDDSVTPVEGQMHKSIFLDRLNNEVCVAVDEALKGTLFSSDNCPYIRSAFARYKNSTAGQLEQTIQRYEPATVSAQSAEDMIQQITMHATIAATRWAQTGDLSGIPPEIASQIPASTKTMAGISTAASDLSQSVSSGIGSIVSGIGSMFFKSDNGGAQATQSPQAVMQGLGRGQSIDSGSKGKMESAFGTSFSDVEIHHDTKAADLSKNMNARAFTVGNHIAFANGEYKPGTLVGDALMAHELAHVEQQNFLTNKNQLESISQRNPGIEETLERDANDSSLNVIGAVWFNSKSGLKNLAKKRQRKLSGGLSLQSCSKKEDPQFTKIKEILNQTPTGREALARQTEFGIGVEFQPGNGTAYHPESDKMIINSTQTPERSALSFVHEMNHAYYQHKGLTADLNIATLTRADYISKMIQEEAEGVVKSIETKMELATTRVNTIGLTYPLENEYTTVYNNARTAGKTEAEAREAGKQEVINGFNAGKVITSIKDPATGVEETYPVYYGNAWDRAHAH